MHTINSVITNELAVTFSPENGGTDSEYNCPFRDAITHVLIVGRRCVRHSEGRDGHPAQSLHSDSTYINQLIEVAEVREPIRPDHGIELNLRLVKYLWEHDHGR